jgi:hypothetical protein
MCKRTATGPYPEKINPFQTTTLSNFVNIYFLNTFGKIFYKVHNALYVLSLCTLNLRDNFGIAFLKDSWTAQTYPEKTCFSAAVSAINTM